MSDMLEEENSALEYLKSLTLLCVEDNKTTQIIYDSIFEDLVKEVIFADNGEDGYQKYIDNEIDIIITDYEMPIMNGLEMAKKIGEVDKEIPIILITAIEDVNIIVDALHLGINSFVKKPLLNKEVIQSVEKTAKVLIENKFLK